ncbi:MAG: hypothetical protein WDZ76_01610 [Pseudohongiellaceae bacterium]
MPTFARLDRNESGGLEYDQLFDRTVHEAVRYVDFNAYRIDI